MTDTSIWFGDVAVAELNDRNRGCLNEVLGIELTEIRTSSLHGRMPVDHRTIQPAGVLHGGASVAFAETLASWGGFLVVDPARFHVVGQEINANHVRPVPDGEWVHGVASPLSIGRRAHVWDVRITSDAGKLVCVSRCTLAVIEVPSTYAPPESRGGRADRPLA